MRRVADSNAMNQVGKPDAGNPQVRFDERGKETGSRLPRLSSTRLNRPHARNSLSEHLSPALRELIRFCGDDAGIGAM